VTRQVSLIAFPRSGARRLTNDINDYRDVSTSSGDEAIAGVRFTNLRNLWLADLQAEKLAPSPGLERRELAARRRDRDGWQRPLRRRPRPGCSALDHWPERWRGQADYPG